MIDRDRLVRQLRWARAEGLGRLIEEKELHPVARLRRRHDERRWQREHARPAGQARPVWVVGLQRSGTNMVMRALDAAPSVESYNENDRRAFVDYRLRPDEQLARLIAKSRSELVVFKPLCDSHLAVHLASTSWPARPARVVWTYRAMAPRVRSATRRFDDAARRALTAIADGDRELWQVGGLDPEQIRRIRRLEPARLDVASAQALWWYVRNSLYFDLGLDQRADVDLLSYDHLVLDPTGEMAQLCAFLDIDALASMTEGLAPRAPSTAPSLSIDPRVRTLCRQLEARFAAAHARLGRPELVQT